MDLCLSEGDGPTLGSIPSSDVDASRSARTHAWRTPVSSYPTRLFSARFTRPLRTPDGTPPTTEAPHTTPRTHPAKPSLKSAAMPRALWNYVLVQESPWPCTNRHGIIFFYVRLPRPDADVYVLQRARARAGLWSARRPPPRCIMRSNQGCVV